MEHTTHYHPPKIGMRVIKTLLSVLLVTLTYDYIFGGRNACFACIGAVYAMGNHFHEGFKFGFNRFVGTLFGGLIVIPFYWLYYHHPLGIPKEFYLVLGLLCLLYLHILSGATTAIQPGAVIYFVVLFTQPVNTYIGYTIARVIDTGIGVIFSLVLNFLLPSKLDKRNGFDFPHTFQRWFKSNQRPSNERYPLDPEPEGNPEQSYEKKRLLKEPFFIIFFSYWSEDGTPSLHRHGTPSPGRHGTPLPHRHGGKVHPYCGSDWCSESALPAHFREG